MPESGAITGATLTPVVNSISSMAGRLSGSAIATVSVLRAELEESSVSGKRSFASQKRARSVWSASQSSSSGGMRTARIPIASASAAQSCCSVRNPSATRAEPSR